MQKIWKYNIWDLWDAVKASRRKFVWLNAYIRKDTLKSVMYTHLKELYKQVQIQRKKEIIKNRNQWNWKKKTNRKKKSIQKETLAIFTKKVRIWKGSHKTSKDIMGILKASLCI